MRYLVPSILAFFLFCGSAFSAGSGLVFVSVEKGDAVVVLDASYRVIKRIETSRRPRDMHFNAARDRLYVACGDDDVIDVIDIAALEVVDSIPTGPSPEIFAFSADGSSLYVSNEDSSVLEQIALESGDSIAEVPTGAEPEGVLVAADGMTIYVTSEVADLVHVVDAASATVTTSIPVGTRPRRFAVTPDGAIWVSNELSGDVSVIDPTTQTVVDLLQFVPPGFRQSDVTPVGMAVTHDGSRVLVTLGHSHHLAVVNAETRQLEHYVLVGARPWSVAVTADDTHAVVANGLSDDITVIDLTTMQAVVSVPVGRVPHTVLVDD